MIELGRQRIYPNKGFTDKIREYLGDKEVFGSCIHYDVDSESLIHIAELIPSENLKDRQNDAPTFRAFLDFANRCPLARFEIYVIVKERFDERVTVEGVDVPKECRDSPLFELLENALGSADESGELEHGYYRYWWD